MVLRPSRAGLASDLRRVIAVSLRCGDNGGYGGHHEFRNFLAQPITSKRNITVLPSRSKFFLIHQHLQRSAQALAGLIGLDDIVKVPQSSRFVRIGKCFLEVLCEAFSFLGCGRGRCVGDG